MGLFDMSGGGNNGYASVKNTQNFTNEDLLSRLSAVKVSFGTPVMGTVGKTPSVMYKNVTDKFDVFVRVNKDDVIMGKIGADGVSSLETAVGLGLSMFLDSKDEGTSTADRAVDELLGVIKKLEEGVTVEQSTQTASVNTSTGSEIALFMKQKLLAVKPKFDIFDQNENNVYHVEGDLARLNYSIQKNGTEVIKLKKKLVAIMPEYTIYKDSKEVAKIKKKFKLTKPELNGKVNGHDLKIKGDIFGYDFDIVVGEHTIGHVDTDFSLFSDCYRIRILDESQADMVIALAIVCDSVHDKEND